jgi:hypothetical protein
MPALGNRVSESDLKVLALLLTAARPEGFITTSRLKKSLLELLKPFGGDAAILANRHDEKFTQIVRNLISHRSANYSIFTLGFATYIPARRGIQITLAGRAFLAKFPN